MRYLPQSLAVASVLAVTATLNTQQMPRPYPGVQTRIPGIFVTPVPNAPFTARVNIISHEILPDGTANIRTTVAHVG
ncbi:hypothetical protein [Edaphobacter aggregans]|uniref:hypothetical protein n=1 Tax=Edaphobacter aggregans TaxID=570835 RepID=UPI00055996CB|nr:hypothetical protein [Edaphobacter aggregans]